MKSCPKSLLVLSVCTSLLAAGVPGPVFAAASATADRALARSGPAEAQALLDEAAAYLGTHPAERAFAAFNNQKGAFHRDDLYTFVVGIDDGIMHAHGGAPEGLVGSRVLELRDAAGKPIIAEMLAAVGGSAEDRRVDYVWLNWTTNRVENKTTLVRQVGRYLVGVGYYAR